MTTNRLAGMALLLVACGGDSGPSEPDPFIGRWWMESINGVPIPTSGDVIAQGFPDPDIVLTGRLELRAVGEGFPIWDFCAEDAGDGHLYVSGLPELRYATGEPGDGVADLIVIQPLSAPHDTLRLQGNVLTWEYNLRSEPAAGVETDLLRFRRLEDGENEGPVCGLVDIRR